MSRLMFSSDLHLGHANVCKWRTQFDFVEQHDDYIIEKHKAVLNKRDTWICLGDVAFTKEGLLRLKGIVCQRKILILGNHCTERGLTVADYLEVFDEVHSMKKCSYQGVKYWITHCPIHPMEMRKCNLNIHGHMHEHSLDDPRYVNACLEHTNYEPIWIEHLLGIQKGESLYPDAMARKVARDALPEPDYVRSTS